MQNEANWTIIDSLDMWGFTLPQNTTAFLVLELEFRGKVRRHPNHPIYMFIVEFTNFLILKIYLIFDLKYFKIFF